MQVVWNVWSCVKSLVSCDTLLFEFVMKRGVRNFYTKLCRNGGIIQIPFPIYISNNLWLFL